MKAILASLPGECVLVFDRYENVSHKDHEQWRSRGGGHGGHGPPNVC